MFQSTHPHGVRPSDVNDFANWLTVSIHAPTRGATERFSEVDQSFTVSIHAPTRGATTAAREAVLSRVVSIHAPTRGATLIYSSILPVSVFQSTHPHGVRLDLLGLARQKLQVSIHAPTRGATLTRMFRQNGTGFNPRTHTGCDQLAKSLTSLACCFNPRTHTGCD